MNYTKSAWDTAVHTDEKVTTSQIFKILDFPPSDALLGCVTSKSKMVAASCSAIHTVDQCGIWWKTQISRSFQTKLWHRAGELKHPCGKTIKVYCWSCQLKANCFWWSLDRYQENARSISTSCTKKCFNWNKDTTPCIVTPWNSRDVTLFFGYFPWQRPTLKASM